MPDKFKGSILLISLAILGSADHFGQTAKEMAEQDSVFKLIPRSIDIFAPQDIANFETLIAMGEKAYPALAQALLETREPRTAATIMTVFAESRGDKRLPIETVGKFVQKWRDAPDFPAVNMRSEAAIFLGKVGGKNEQEFLLELMDDPSERVRIVSADALAKIGDSTVLLRLSDWLERRKQQVGLGRDLSIRYAEQSIAELRERLASPAAPVPQASPAPSSPAATMPAQAAAPASPPQAQPLPSSPTPTSSTPSPLPVKSPEQPPSGLSKGWTAAIVALVVILGAPAWLRRSRENGSR